MKLLVETEGAVQFIDPAHSTHIRGNRPTVAPSSNFIHLKASQGQILVLAQDLKPEATDEVFAEYWAESKGDKDLAVASFLSKYGKDAVEQEQTSEDTAPTTTRRRRG
jgi:hypothetical protein